ncbi:PREDICTED: uncharacterized protein K02A2.6-like [Priapulus caudatus]|uniref:Uncharacterized protein K02A2.6-like n=1 Tax=Priapulus caudatus TaxID=37621 RepID=A0ABM1E9R2_PRICU|nr:PREDICTED: uncharacterized protein K02A2.6-like [Priapulus caudatus]
MAEAYVKAPETLEIYRGNLAHSWDKWKRKFSIYIQATGSTSKPNEQKIGLLLHSIGDQGIEIYTNFVFSVDESRKSHDDVIRKYDEHFTKRDPQLMLRERYWLHLKREPGHFLDAWFNTVRERASECKFPEQFHEQAIRDNLTFSCADDGAKLKLYDQGARLSLEKAFQVLSMREATSQELKESKTASIEAVRYQPPRVSQKTPWRKGNIYDKIRKNTPQQGVRCGYCDRSHPFGKRNCPAANHKCRKCTKTGHFEAICKSSGQMQVRQIEGERHHDKQPSHTFGGGVREEITSDPGWHIKLTAGIEELIWCIDTGAQVSVMPEKAYHHSFGELSMPDKELVGAGDKRLNIVGCADMSLCHGNTQVKKSVVRGASKLLLGVPAIRSLGLIHHILGTCTVRAIDAKAPVLPLRTKTEVMEAYPMLFTGLGRLEGEHAIRLKEGVKPFCLTTTRRVALPLLKKVQRKINCLVKLDVVESVDEPTDWCAPIVVVPKRSGDVRMCVDRTRLNEAVQKELYPMPTVECTLGKIAEGMVYSKLDANSGFHQVALNQESRKLTRFITPFGRFLYKRLPYGITSAPEYYQKRMDQILKDLPRVICHVDDILVTERNQIEHNERLRAVLDRLQQAGLTLNPDKCVFSLASLDYLGQIVDGQGIRKDPAKSKAIVDFREPQDVNELRRFLGMANQLTKFCLHMAESTKPLRDLLKKSAAWLWGPAQTAAFKDVKEELVSERILAMYNPERETVVSADARSFGLGAVLLQRQASGELRPVAYASR